MLANSLLSEIRKNLDKVQNQLLPDILERISSGKKIKYLSDNPVVASQGLLVDLDIKSVNAGIDNLNCALDFLNVAVIGVNNVYNCLLDMQELAAKANDSLLSEEEKITYDAEFQQKIEDIFRVTKGSVFMGKPVLTGELDDLTIQIGPKSSDVVSFSIGNFTINTDGEGLDIANLSIDDQESIDETLQAMPVILETFNSRVANLSTQESGFLSFLDNQKVLNESLGALKSRIYDIDLAEEMTSLTTAQMKMNASITALSYANNIQSKTLSALLGISW